MIYDDDTGRRPYFPISNDDREPDKNHKENRSVRLPSAATQQLIVHMAQRPGWETERIHAYLRQKYNRHDVTLDMIRAVIAQSRAPRRSL
ncbi:hypothetical protein [Amycolatopsis sp. NPDC051371]|uniref:hypothetical protein n=1 Tax=Amycolatopsis sp. NPDC051371 TaxID=3155800 RepID=UPI003441B27C